MRFWTPSPLRHRRLSLSSISVLLAVAVAVYAVPSLPPWPILCERGDLDGAEGCRRPTGRLLQRLGAGGRQPKNLAREEEERLGGEEID